MVIAVVTKMTAQSAPAVPPVMVTKSYRDVSTVVSK